MLGAIIFDVDGTLAETEELHRRAFNETFAEAGLDWHWTQADYTLLLKTTGGKERIARFINEIKEDPADFPVAALHAAKTERYVAMMTQGGISLRPGIADLLDQARVSGVRLAVATTTSLPNVQALAWAVFGTSAEQMFEVIASGDMVPAKKPAPDVYRLALDSLGLAVGQVVALEDSLNGLRSAKAAGIRCVVAPGFYSRDEDLSGADLLLDDFSDLDGLAGLCRSLNLCGENP